jgi:carbonic anhydrase
MTSAEEPSTPSTEAGDDTKAPENVQATQAAESTVSTIDELLRRHEQGPDHGAPQVPTPVPSLHLAVVTCMDARIKVFDVFGLRHGEIHILRNAGGIVTDDVIRSLAISQRKLATREIVIMQHTSCGMSLITEDGFRDELEADTGLRPTWSVEAFTDVEASVRQSVARVRHSPFLTLTTQVRGFVYDVHTAKIHEVT